MTRRTFLQGTLAAAIHTPLLAALRQGDLDDASNILSRSIESSQIACAVLHISQRGSTFTRHYGKAGSADAMFLLGSITKPLCVTALMTLFDRGAFALDDSLTRFLPKFTGDGREQVTLLHLLTHTSGLPDQLAENDRLRRSHAPLSEFINHAIRTPLSFSPGQRYQYSSMGILLATHLAELITKTPLPDFIQKQVLDPLGMKHSALGLGGFKLDEMIPMQTDRAAPESGGGDPNAKDWDWNSLYWRKLAAPWGGAHCSAPDIARWLNGFLTPAANILKPQTLKLMITNQNPAGITPRGLGFHLGPSFSAPDYSAETFGHTGSTGTICWADPATATTCVILTSLPARAITPHPRDLASRHAAAAAR